MSYSLHSSASVMQGGCVDAIKALHALVCGEKAKSTRLYVRAKQSPMRSAPL